MKLQTVLLKTNRTHSILIIQIKNKFQTESKDINLLTSVKCTKCASPQNGG